MHAPPAARTPPPLPPLSLSHTHTRTHTQCTPCSTSCSLKEKKIKNITRDELGTTLGRVHMERQDMDKLQLKKTRATKAEIRERKKAAKAGGGGGGGGGGAAEEEEDEEEVEEEEEEEEAPAQAPGAGSKRARQ